MLFISCLFLSCSFPPSWKVQPYKNCLSIGTENEPMMHQHFNNSVKACCENSCRIFTTNHCGGTTTKKECSQHKENYPVCMSECEKR